MSDSTGLLSCRCVSHKRSIDSVWEIVELNETADVSRRGHMNTDDAKAEARVDWIVVSREAHELALRHGRTAHIDAARLADKAESAGDVKAARFWRAVSRSLMSRLG
jgi:hypothetical protein